MQQHTQLAKYRRFMFGIGIGFAAISCLGIMLWLHGNRMGTKEPVILSKSIISKEDVVQAALALNWTSIDYTGKNYQGPVIQIALVNEKGVLWHYRSVDFQPLGDFTSTGGGVSFEGAESVKLRLVEGPARFSDIRVDTRYKAWKTWVVDGEQFVQQAEFTIPKSALKDKLYRFALIFPTPPESGKRKSDPPPSPFQIEGIAPSPDPSVEYMRMIYRYKNGKELVVKDSIKSGDPFKIGVDSLGGDLVFFDGDLRIAYGLKLAVKTQQVGNVDVLLGHLDYKLTRSAATECEFVEFFTADQARIAIVCGVFPPEKNETSVKLIPGKYRIRVSPADVKDRSAFPLKDIVVGDDSVLKIEP